MARGVDVSLPWTGDEWVVTLDAGCRVTLHVTDPDGKPAAGTSVRMTPIAPDGSEVEDDADVLESDHRGLIEVRLPAGRRRAEALDDERKPVVAQEFEAVEGGSADVWLTLPR